MPASKRQTNYCLKRNERLCAKYLELMSKAGNPIKKSIKHYKIIKGLAGRYRLTQNMIRKILKAKENESSH